MPTAGIGCCTFRMDKNAVSLVRLLVIDPLACSKGRFFVSTSSRRMSRDIRYT